MTIIKKILCASLFIIPMMPATAQRNIVAQMVQEKFAARGEQKITANLLQPDAIYKSALVSKAVSKSIFVQLNPETSVTLAKKNPDVLSLSIPNENGETWVLDLISSQETFRNTSVVLASGKEFNMQETGAAYYRGVIRGQETESLASISIFNNQVSGTIATKNGNTVIGKLTDGDIHIVYNDRDLLKKNPFSCTTADAPLTNEEKMLYTGDDIGLPNFPVVSNNCVDLYYETEFDMFQTLGNNAANVRNFVTALHNQVASIYLNEGIRTPLSEIRVWDINDPYNGTNTATLLTQFQANTAAINGDLGQLLTFRAVGGGRAAGFAGICAANVDNSLSVSGIDNGFQNVPVYSWSVMVVTHEFGHTFGSRHTHACVWNGNNTAIDGCSGATEGGCALPGNPANGGTIMSYCHQQTVGINFLNGFGQQPGDVIRNRVNTGGCLAACCQRNVIIFGNFNNPLTESGDWIRSSGLTNIASGTRVTLDANPAGGHVELTPGFEARSGSVFIAQAFNGCIAGQPSIASNNRLVQEEQAAAIPKVTSSANRLQLYPNPAQDVIYIQAPQKAGKVIALELLDAQGRRVLLNTKNNNHNQVNVGGLKPGSYFLKVITQETTYQAAFIKQ